MSFSLISVAIPVILILSSCSQKETEQKADSKQIEAKSTAEDEAAKMNTLLTRFDSLDFVVYSNQQWENLHASHADNILVHYPDGHTTTGLPDHIKELTPTFVFAPDVKVTEHPVKFGHGEWTSVIGVVEGTFTKPMPIGNGKSIPPTGKKFRFEMCTVGHWKNGKMIEEYLFWDNLSFMKEIGVMQ
ncbi:polyketide cyclase [Sphingobacteriaceae bacterium]|nr:polyketide cyclase [Sphingobacteriaceae bacterium]